jgi:hypothetical protein
MNAKATLLFVEEDGHAAVRIGVRGPALIGRWATLKVVREAKVKRSSGVDHEQVLLERRFQIERDARSFALPPDPGRRWVYRGKHLDLRVTATLVVDDSVLRDTKVVVEASQPMFPGPLAPESSRRQADPADRFSLFANLKAVPWRNRIMAIALLVVGIPLVLANAVLGWNDQYAAPGRTTFYDHRDSDGDSQSPLVNALMVSGGLGFALWLALRSQLRRYMEIEVFASRVPKWIEPGTRLEVRDLVRGKVRVPLQDCLLRVVAFNREKGQVKQRSKDKTEIRPFAEIVRAVVLFEQRLPHVPAGSQLGGWIEGEVDFAPLFTRLHPPVTMGQHHGIDIRWEVQLVHPRFVDQELELPDVGFRFPAAVREVPPDAKPGQGAAQA